MLHSSDSEEKLNWESEAEAIICDVKDHVNHIAVSRKLKSSRHEIYLNLKTIEDKDFCIRASAKGFQVVAEEYDQVVEKKINNAEDDEPEEEIFETPYALLNKISPRYVESFAKKLSSQLENLENRIE